MSILKCVANQVLQHLLSSSTTMLASVLIVSKSLNKRHSEYPVFHSFKKSSIPYHYKQTSYLHFYTN